MRVAIVANTAWYLFNFRVNLMRALEADGHEVVAIAPEDEYTDRLRAIGLQTISVPISGRGMNPVVELASVFRLGRVFRRQDIDLVLSYTPKGNLYSGLACRVLGIGFAPNVSGLGRVFVHRSALTSLVERLYAFTFARAAKVFFQNNEDMRVFVDKGLVDRARAERVPGSGVDLKRFAPVSCAARAPDEAVFLLIARLLWDKGVAEFVDAARAIRADHPRARFQLLGFVDSGNAAAVPQSVVESWVREGCIEYLGSTDDVRGFIEQADCVVLPSTYREGVPRVLLEAAAMCRPVVTTDAPGCRDTVVDGVTGFLCRPSDAADLTDKLRRLLGMSLQARGDMGQRGRKLIERRFDERLVINRYRHLLRPELQPAGRRAQELDLVDSELHSGVSNSPL